MRIIFSLVWAALALSCAPDGFSATRTSTVLYNHSTVGTTAQDAILAASVDRLTYGWSVCHDAESASTFLAISSAVDPLTNGIRIGPGDCFHCSDCGSRSLINVNVVGQAAGTGYSVISKKQ